MAISTGSSEVRLSLRSRYRNTRVRKDSESGEVFFGPWRPPPIIESRPPRKHQIAPDEVHRPDLIAHREYGDKTLFWAIAMRNNMLFPLLDIRRFLSEGKNTLLIPHIDDVLSALQKSSPKNASTER